MAEIIKMPKLSDTMEEGVVAKWHKNVGSKIEDGELLAEIETDKATMEFESFQSGTLLYQGVEEGGSAEVDAVLAIVGEEGEDFSVLLNENNINAKSVDPDKEHQDSQIEDPIKEEGTIHETVDISNISAKVIKMPKLSDTMTEGVVASWAKNIGDKVESGELLAEIETDKATMEFESFEEGILLYQGVKEGESAPVDDILAIVGEKGADYQKLIQSFAQNDQPENTAITQANVPIESNKIGEGDQAASNKTSSSINGDQGRIKISPLARRLAEEKSIDITSLNGTGDGGRIVKRDIENYQPLASVSATVESHPLEESFEEVAVSQMRKTIAKRLGESKFSSPHFYLTIDIDMEEAIKARKAINELPETKISFNDLVIRAASAALKKHPQVNSSWLGDKIRYNKYVHIGVAVAVEDGLVVPVVKHADQKLLSTISSEVKDFASRARDKKLQLNEMEGSTFSISNLGMFGIEEFTAIINPPNACIMAVGAIREEPVVKNGEIVVGSRMKVTLSCDHRAVDGAMGSEFLQTFKSYLQNPVTILG